MVALSPGVGARVVVQGQHGGCLRVVALSLGARVVVHSPEEQGGCLHGARVVVQGQHGGCLRVVALSPGARVVAPSPQGSTAAGWCQGGCSRPARRLPKGGCLSPGARVVVQGQQSLGVGARVLAQGQHGGCLRVVDLSLGARVVVHSPQGTKAAAWCQGGCSRPALRLPEGGCSDRYRIFSP